VTVEAVGFEILVLHKSTGAVQRLEDRAAVALREVMAGRDPHRMGLGDVLEILVDLRIVEPTSGKVSRRKLLGLSAAAAGVGIMTITMPQAVAASSTEDDDISNLAAPSGFVSSISGITVNGSETSGGFGLSADGSTLRTDGYFYSSATVTNFPGCYQARVTVVGGSGGGGGANDGVAGRGAIVIAVVNVDQYSDDRLDIHVGAQGGVESGSYIGLGGGRVGGLTGSGLVGPRIGGNGGGGGGGASMVTRSTFSGDPLLVIAGGGGGGGRGSSGNPGGYGGHSGRNGSAGEGVPGGGGGGGALQNGTAGAAGSPDAGLGDVFRQATPGAGPSGDPDYQLGDGEGGHGGEENASGGGGGAGFAGGGGGGSGTFSAGGGGGGSSWSADVAASFGLRGTTGDGYVRLQLKQTFCD
jgi:hypothetical protein